MTTPSKRKGDRAELEAAELLTQALRRPVRRLLGAGRADDVGDLTGVPGWALQVAWWPADTLRAIRRKPLDAAEQAARSNLPHSAAVIRLVGGEWRIVMTLDQYAAVVLAQDRAKHVVNTLLPPDPHGGCPDAGCGPDCPARIQ